MTTYISILRGINVGGQKSIRMEDLKALYEKCGFTDVTTFIQSGNVIFKSKKKLSDTQLATAIEEGILKKYKFSVPVIIRTGDEMRNIISENPFLKQKNINTDKLHVTFFAASLGQTLVEALERLDFSPDKFYIFNKEAYLYIPESYGRTKLSNSFFENKLKVKATTRNWNTVNKLAEMAAVSR